MERSSSKKNPGTLSGVVACCQLKSLIVSPSSRRPCFRLEPVFDDLSVERASADVEGPGRLFLIPSSPFEHAHDMRTLGLGQGRHTWRSIRSDRGLRMEEFDV